MADSPDLKQFYRQRLGKRWEQAPFVLRFTTWKELPPPVLVAKERQEAPQKEGEAQPGRLVERGHIYGGPLRRLLPVLRPVLAGVRDEADIPLELQRFLTQEGLRLRLNLPLDEAAGAKLSLIFRLQERVTDLDRVELIARRVARFTREEAVYWLSRMTSYGPDANRWAIAGMRIVLGGTPKDGKGVERMLKGLQGSS